MPFRENYNGCKTYGCPNCGNPEQSLYSRSDRLGYDAWYCSECGAYPPVLLNQPILALAEQIRTRQCDNFLFRHCACRQPTFQRYGFTASGSQRVQCTQCHQVVTLLNARKLANRLQPIMDALTHRVRPGAIQKACHLSGKEFATRLPLLAQLLTQVSRGWEKEIDFALIQTRTTRQVCRSGLQHGNNKQYETRLWTLSSADSQSGYLLLFNDNALYDDVSLTSAVLAQSLYHLDHVEPDLDSNIDVLNKAEHTYSKILARSQFDKLAYSLQRHAKSKEAQLLRPVYAAHAHFQNLYRMTHCVPPSAIILEHESFLRGASITAFSHEIGKGQTDLYYCHLTQKIDTLMPPVISKNMSWWNEKWYRLSIENKHGNWQAGIGVLTNEHSKIRQILPSHPDWNQYFWHGFNHWLTPEYARRISLKRLHQWQAVYRYLYNLVFTDRLNIKATHGIEPTQISTIVDFINQEKLNSRKL
ncbi:hypothetical protein Q4491_11185 [Photobacterium sp. 2_MG-2023]|uniref:hypothetical protein n=1 Tax=Photobacterium sp. 2_MG-2023 TaxID=3062663 RepID=UPI0026E27AC8|nr:hypothetical protein [Photobacterium sp. 2_MG-2023]MDO6581911.1 hypothetical protein [Photobacterium sp. 2_MG-2023]